MRKLFVVVIAVLACAGLALADDAYVKQVNIGQDKSGMTWYLLDYGTKKNIPYAVARKYYTSDMIKSETIELLTSRYSVPETKAQRLYFTEYKYEYSTDGRQYAEIYRKYYDVAGEEIYGIRFNKRSGARSKHFIKVVKNTIQSKGAAYALGVLKKY